MNRDCSECASFKSNGVHASTCVFHPDRIAAHVAESSPWRTLPNGGVVDRREVIAVVMDGPGGPPMVILRNEWGVRIDNSDILSVVKALGFVVADTRTKKDIA